VQRKSNQYLKMFLIFNSEEILTMSDTLISLFNLTNQEEQ
jgi:hypothetical protein